MIRFFFSVILTLCTSVFLNAQKPPIKFGDVTEDMLKMTRYDKDTSAAAVVLMDYGQSTISYSVPEGAFKLFFERTTRIKVLTKDGLDKANFSIPLYHDGGAEEKILNIKATTYNFEGNKIVATKIKSDGVFKTKVSENWMTAQVTLPAVKEGSVVEINYKVSSDFLFNFWNWEFQSTIPIVWSEYRVAYPEYYSYDKYMQGYIQLVVNESSRNPNSIVVNTTERSEGRSNEFSMGSARLDYTDLTSRWVAQDVPAFKDEPFMTSDKDYISKINFELVSMQFPNQPPKYYRGSWEAINESFLKSDAFGGLVEGSGFLNKKVDELTHGMTTPAEKISAIYAYVKENVSWNGEFRKYSDGFKEPLEKKKGNSADINLLLTSMLQKAGLTSNPILISTRDNGFVREDRPITSQFNYVISSVIVDGKTILLDATDPLLPITLLPERCMNGQGFIISKEKSGWAALKTNVKSRVYTNMELVLKADGELTGKVKVTRSGYAARGVRSTFSKKGEEAYAKGVAGQNQWDLQASTFENVTKPSEDVQEAYELTLTQNGQLTGDHIYLNPIVADKLDENPFKAEKREYPVDFGSPIEYLHAGRITLPDGWVVEEIPLTKMIALPGNAAKFVYSIAQVGNTITLTNQLTINRPLFIQDEYQALREFYNIVIAKQAEQIVLKKQ